MPYMIRGLGYPRLSGFGQVAPPVRVAPVDVLVAFPFDKHTLVPRHHQQLIALARQILASPAGQPVLLTLIGHTDPVGTAAYNQDLGLRRAGEVRRQLLATLERMRPGSGRGMTVTIESRGATQPVAGSKERSRRVEIVGPGAPAVVRPPQVTAPAAVKVPPALPTLADAVARSLRLLQAKPLDAEPTKRLRCVLGMIQDPSVDDAYINGYDTVMQGVIKPVPQELFTRLLMHVRTDLTKQWFGPTSTDDFARDALRMIDERIFMGIAFMNKQMHTQGAAMAPGKVQIKDWMAGQQRNSKSIYSCYGGPRDR